MVKRQCKGFVKMKVKTIDQPLILAMYSSNV